MNLWEMRLITEDDQTEVGMRVSCALHAENNTPGKGRYDMICFRAYDAARLRRSKEKRNSGKTT